MLLVIIFLYFSFSCNKNYFEVIFEYVVNIFLPLIALDHKAWLGKNNNRKKNRNFDLEFFLELLAIVPTTAWV